jgi:hypothetical protein
MAGTTVDTPAAMPQGSSSGHDAAGRTWRHESHAVAVSPAATAAGDVSGAIDAYESASPAPPTAVPIPPTVGRRTALHSARASSATMAPAAIHRSSARSHSRTAARPTAVACPTVIAAEPVLFDDRPAPTSSTTTSASDAATPLTTGNPCRSPVPSSAVTATTTAGQATRRVACHSAPSGRRRWARAMADTVRATAAAITDSWNAAGRMTSSPETIVLRNAPLATPMPNQAVGATTKRAVLAGRRRTTAAIAAATARHDAPWTIGSARPVTSGGTGAPSVTHAIATTGVTAAPTSSSAAATTRAPRRPRTYADPKHTVGASTSGSRRNCGSTSPSENAISPNTPAKSSSTPTYARPCTARSLATAGRTRDHQRAIVPGSTTIGAGRSCGCVGGGGSVRGAQIAGAVDGHIGGPAGDRPISVGVTTSGGRSVRSASNRSTISWPIRPRDSASCNRSARTSRSASASALRTRASGVGSWTTRPPHDTRSVHS